MKRAIALCCALSFLLGAQSAVAGPGKGVVTHLVPKQVVEEKPLPPPEKKCRVVKRVITSTEGGSQTFTPAQFIQPGCCCGTTGTFIQGVDVRVPATTTTIIQTNTVCE